jgi:cyanophycin synthetase
VALELQTVMGHDVGYGRTRGGAAPGEYTCVFEHCHEQVGLRAAALALEVVQRAFTGALEPGHVAAAVSELASLAETPDAPALRQHVFCGITGGTGRLECQQELRRRLQASGYEMQSDNRDAQVAADDLLITDLSPGFLMQAGLPYSRSEMAIILDTDISGVADRHREPDHARRLLSLLADAVRTGGMVICPAKEWEIQDYARDEECRVAVFATDDDVTRRDLKVASASGLVRDGRIWVEHFGDPKDAGPVSPDLPVAAQVAAALAASVSNARHRTGDASD